MNSQSVFIHRKNRSEHDKIRIEKGITDGDL